MKCYLFIIGMCLLTLFTSAQIRVKPLTLKPLYASNCKAIKILYADTSIGVILGENYSTDLNPIYYNFQVVHYNGKTKYYKINNYNSEFKRNLVIDHAFYYQGKIILFGRKSDSKNLTYACIYDTSGIIVVPWKHIPEILTVNDQRGVRNLDKMLKGNITFSGASKNLNKNLVSTIIQSLSGDHFMVANSSWNGLSISKYDLRLSNVLKTNITIPNTKVKDLLDVVYDGEYVHFAFTGTFNDASDKEIFTMICSYKPSNEVSRIIILKKATQVIKNAILKSNKDGGFAFAGFYNEPEEPKINRILVTQCEGNSDTVTYESKLKIPEMQNLYLDGKKPFVRDFIYLMKPTSIYRRDDGGLYIVTEEYFTRTADETHESKDFVRSTYSGNSRTDHYEVTSYTTQYGQNYIRDCWVISLDSAGRNIINTRISKFHFHFDHHEEYSSYNTSMINNKLFVFFNNHKDNFKPKNEKRLQVMFKPKIAALHLKVFSADGSTNSQILQTTANSKKEVIQPSLFYNNSQQGIFLLMGYKILTPVQIRM